MTRAQVASVATGSLPATMRFILRGVPSVGPLPSIATKPSMTVKCGFYGGVYVDYNFTDAHSVVLEFEFVRKQPKHVLHAQSNFSRHMSLHFSGADNS